LGGAALKKAACERAEAYRLHMEWAFRQPGVNGRPISYRAAAKRLEERNIESPMGGRWRGHQLLRMALRIGLHHPTRRQQREVEQAWVRAIYTQHPDFTAKQVIANMGTEHPLGFARACTLLRECRMAAAKRSSAQKQIGGYLDCRTDARIRISAMWKRHPEFTAQQVIEKLMPGPFMTVRWVHQIMKECRRASARHSPEQRRIGGRIYSPLRGLNRPLTASAPS
jgi:hypothetical protein